MKSVASFVVALIIALSFAGASSAQDAGYRVSAVSVGSGETPISGGISASVNLTNDDGGFIQIMAQSEQGWFMAGKDWKMSNSRCSLYASVGHFQGAPWVGPYAECVLTVGHIGKNEVSVGALTWPGFYIGREPRNWRNDGKENTEAVLAGYFSIATVSVGGFSMSISHLNFLDDSTNYLPGVSYTQKVRHDMDASGSVTWNINSRSPMFFVGATWHPAKK